MWSFSLRGMDDNLRREMKRSASPRPEGYFMAY
jgi:hypothetical protein